MDSRKIRVSAFPPGVAIDDRPAFHSASKKHERAALNFRRQRRRILDGSIARVVMHYGNLKHRSYTIVEDVQHWTEADELTATLTAFESFNALMGAPGGYRPSLSESKPAHRKLADLYDAAQERRGDPRRAHRNR